MTSFIVRGEEYLVNLAKQAASGVASIFVHDIEPAVETFIKQFASDFGQKIFADAEALAPGVLANPSTIVTAATQLVTQAASQAGGIAAQDALTVALNALRVHVTNLNPPNTNSTNTATAPVVSSADNAPVQE